MLEQRRKAGLAAHRHKLQGSYMAEQSSSKAQQRRGSCARQAAHKLLKHSKAEQRRQAASKLHKHSRVQQRREAVRDTLHKQSTA